MISIVMPAHNEAQVISRTLRTLTTGAPPEQLDVVVVCNGCTDDTAAIARSFGAPVRVIETAVANKAHALNLGDQASISFPRFYIDADVVIAFSDLRTLADRLEKPDVMAVAPTPHFELSGCSWPVRAFYNIRCRLPSFGEGIGGSGVYGLSKTGRSRFGAFPNLIADDTYVRVQFKREERATLKCARSTVFVPHTVKNLIAIETRADFGTRELEWRHPDLWRNKGRGNQKALLSLLGNPLLWPQLCVYWFVRTAARRRAGVLSDKNTFVWERDDTSRKI